MFRIRIIKKWILMQTLHNRKFEKAFNAYSNIFVNFAPEQINHCTNKFAKNEITTIMPSYRAYGSGSEGLKNADTSGSATLPVSNNISVYYTTTTTGTVITLLQPYFMFSGSLTKILM